MRIVVIVGSYAPNYSAVGVCAKNIVDEFTNLGHDVFVIAEESTAPLPQDLRERVIRVSSRIHSLLLKPQKKYRTLYRAIRFARSICQTHNVKWDMVGAYLEGLKQVSTSGNIDLIVPFCFPFEGCYAAAMFKTKNMATEVIPFLFDRFAASTSLHRMNINRRFKFQRHLRLENIVFQNSTKILFLPSWSDHIKNYHKNCKAKFVKCEHPLLKPLYCDHYLFDNKKVNIVYTGALLKKVRDPKYCLLCIDNIIKYNNNIVIHFYSLGDCQEEINSYQAKYPNNVCNHGLVTSDEAHNAIAGADILLSIGNNDISQFASKNFEYISTGNPIIHFFKHSEDPVNRLLNKYGNAVLVSESETIEESSKKIVSFICSDLKKISFSDIKSSLIEATPSYIVQQLFPL